MKDLNDINYLLSLPDKELQSWLQENKDNRSLSEDLAGLVLMWKENKHDVSAIKQAVNFDMLSGEIRKKASSSIYRIAAGIAVIALLSAVTWYFVNRTSKDKYAAFYMEEPALPVFLGDNEVQWTEAMRFYEEKKYDLSLKEMDKLSDSDTLKYYKAICLYKAKKEVESLALLNRIKSGGRYYAEASYLRGYIYAQMGDLEKARVALNQIPAGSNLYSSALLFKKKLEKQK